MADGAKLEIRLFCHFPEPFGSKISGQ